MKAESLSCWRCGASLAELPLPLSRFAECADCGADLHVCRLCRFYDPRMIGQCTHDRAERVEVKERANFCTHFRPTPHPLVGDEARRDREARRELEALFDRPAGPGPSDPKPEGGTATPSSPGASGSGAESEEEKARRELEALFGLRSGGDGSER